MTHRVLRTAQLGLGIAVAAALVACSAATPDVSNGQSAEELFQGDWIVTKYTITFDSAPNNPISVTDSSDVNFSIADGKYVTWCFPACLGITRSSEGTYYIDEDRKTIRMITTDVDLEAEYEIYRSQYIGSEGRAEYRFPSRDRLRLEIREQVLTQGVFIQATVIIEAKRDS
ncbi:MAG: hypothetical protein OXJ62_00545 [Spirochaetaceae bacterium]|nr:hypothetical protein [Spirochaetaceae bacterium]